MFEETKRAKCLKGKQFEGKKFRRFRKEHTHQKCVIKKVSGWAKQEGFN
jgi:hypothetical protein